MSAISDIVERQEDEIFPEDSNLTAAKVGASTDPIDDVITNLQLEHLGTTSHCFMYQHSKSKGEDRKYSNKPFIEFSTRLHK